MTITQVKIRLVPKYPRLKAIASITIDNELIINDIAVIQTEKRLYIDFPKHPYAQKNRMEYVVPLNSDVRHSLEATVLEAYKKEQRCG